MILNLHIYQQEVFCLQQQQLNQIKTWREQVSSITKSFCTDNGIFFVDCHELQLWIVPKLNNIFKQLVQMVVLDVIRLSDEEVKDVEKLSEVHVIFTLGNNVNSKATWKNNKCDSTFIKGYSKNKIAGA